MSVKEGCDKCGGSGVCHPEHRGVSLGPLPCSCTRQEPPKRPQRAWVFELRVEGDTRETAVALLKQMATEIESGHTRCVIGGYDCGSHYDTARNPDQTHESYVAEVEAWLAGGGG